MENPFPLLFSYYGELWRKEEEKSRIKKEEAPSCADFMKR